jgi:hypothetical protein
VRAQYLLAPTSLDVKGKLIGLDGSPSDNLGYGLYRVDGPVVLRSHVSGLYADSWSGRAVVYRRLDCTGGKLAVVLQSDPNLYKRAQVVTASEGGRVVGRISVAPTAMPTLTVPLRSAGGVCVVDFRMKYLRKPLLVEADNTDSRLLGARFLSLTPLP